jgi:putative nucleotidyltransferase with HDIG domain
MTDLRNQVSYHALQQENARLHQQIAELEQRLHTETSVLTNQNDTLQAEVSHYQEIEQKLRSDIQDHAQHERELEAIISVATSLRIADSRAELVSSLLEQIASLLDVQGIALYCYNPLNDSIVLEQAYGLWEQVVGQEANPTSRYQADAPPQACAATNGAFEQDSHAHALSTNFSAYIPLSAQEQTIGMLGIGCRHTITRGNLRILSAIGDIAANALHRVTLYEQTERRLKHIQALHTIDQTITTSLNLRVTLNVFIYQASSQLDIDAVSVLLLNSEANRLEYAAGMGFRTNIIRQKPVPVGEGYAGRTALGVEFVHIPNVQQDTQENIRSALFTEEGFITYYGVPLIAKGRTKGVLELFHRSVLIPDQEWLDFLSTLAGQASIAIDNADMFIQLQQSNEELSRAYDATIEGWARALELRDAETEGHCRRVTELTVQLARKMGFSEDAIVQVRRGAILHDIGKMAIPDSILLKPGPLTDEERHIMEQHTIYAYNLLSCIPFLRTSLDIPYCHHEKWDGSGYPRGLKGDDIPLVARIFAVVDVWDALCSDRPYRDGWPPQQAADYIRGQAGHHFDPAVVETFLAMMLEA